MFTLDQIDDIHLKLGNQATLPEYLQALKAIGVERYDSFLTDGHSEYYGKNDFKIVSPPVHDELLIASTSNKENMLKHLSMHSEGKTNYLQMSEGLAASGIEKWSFDTNKMTITYYDIDKRDMLTETIG